MNDIIARSVRVVESGIEKKREREKKGREKTGISLYMYLS